MSSSSLTTKLPPPPLETRIQVFIAALKRRSYFFLLFFLESFRLLYWTIFRQLDGSFYIAKETADILRNLIGTLKFTTLEELLKSVMETGRRLIAAQPLQFVIGNMVRRLLRICREEYRNMIKKTTSKEKGISSFDSNFENEARIPIENSSNLNIDKFSLSLRKQWINLLTIITAELKKSIQSTISEVIQLDLTSSIPDVGGDYIHSKWATNQTPNFS